MQGSFSFAFRKEEAQGMGEHLTQDEAIRLLRAYRRDVCQYNPSCLGMTQRDTAFLSAVRGKSLISELIRRIRQSDDLPIHVVYDFYTMLDQILSETEDDHFETLQFARQMEYQAGMILRYLKRAESEMVKG